jgi:hypothetical protein
MKKGGKMGPKQSSKKSTKVSVRKPMDAVSAGPAGMGGAIPGYAKGGSIDGVAKKGKTKGKMC